MASTPPEPDDGVPWRPPPPSPPPSGPPPPLPVGLFSFPGPPDTIGRLVIEVAGHMNSSVLTQRYLPRVSINGSPLIDLHRGTNVGTMPAGHYNVVVGVGSDLRQGFVYGTATAGVTVFPRRTTTVYYHAPLLLISKGAIGPTPQGPPDKLLGGCVIAVVAAFMAVGLGYSLVDALIGR